MEHNHGKFWFQSEDSKLLQISIVQASIDLKSERQIKPVSILPKFKIGFSEQNIQLKGG
jgi:hypothetical protein